MTKKNYTSWVLRIKKITVGPGTYHHPFPCKPGTNGWPDPRDACLRTRGTRTRWSPLGHGFLPATSRVSPTRSPSPPHTAAPLRLFNAPVANPTPVPGDRRVAPVIVARASDKQDAARRQRRRPLGNAPGASQNAGPRQGWASCTGEREEGVGGGPPPPARMLGGWTPRRVAVPDSAPRP